MALTRLNDFDAGTKLTETKLEGEFDRIYTGGPDLAFPLPKNVSAAGFDLTSLGEAHFDSEGDASAAGRLRRNGVNLTWHDGTAAGRIFYVGGTDVPVADGGTGASTAADARTNLGVGLTLAGSNTTEQTTTGSTDLVTVTTSLAVGTPFIVLANFRKTSGAAATFSIGLKLNATTVRSAVAVTTATDQAESGGVMFVVFPHDASYLNGGFMLHTSGSSDSTSLRNFGTAAPNAAITSVIITAVSGDGAITCAVKDVYVYALATS